MTLPSSRRSAANRVVVPCRSCTHHGGRPIFREEPVKVTIALSRRSVEFFKSEAARHHTQYQKMIRRLLDQYAEHYSQPEVTRASRPGRRRTAA